MSPPTQKSNVAVTSAIWVDGVGYLDEYGSYCDTVWSKGVVYFLRDSYLRQLHTDPTDRALIDRYNRLNSDIQKWEQNGGRVE